MPWSTNESSCSNLCSKGIALGIFRRGLPLTFPHKEAIKSFHAIALTEYFLQQAVSAARARFILRPSRPRSEEP